VSSLVYPTLPGLTYEVVRTPILETGVQTALSRKRSTIQYMLYPVISFELTYSVLRDVGAPAYTSTTSEIKQLVGLFLQLYARWDTFLFTDPDFNTILSSAPQTFAIANGGAGPYQIVASYENPGGPGASELIQNLSGTPVLYDNGAAISGSNYTLGPTGQVTFNSGHFPTNGDTLSWSGSWYYRCAFDEDKFTATKFMNKLWSNKSVKFTSVKL
jgi:hypothetical protein